MGQKRTKDTGTLPSLKLARARYQRNRAMCENAHPDEVSAFEERVVALRLDAVGVWMSQRGGTATKKSKETDTKTSVKIGGEQVSSAA